MLVIVINCLLSFCCCHGDGSDGWHVCTKYHGHTQYFQATMLVIVINCPRLFIVDIYCYRDGRHVCTKYHGHTYFYQQLISYCVDF